MTRKIYLAVAAVVALTIATPAGAADIAAGKKRAAMLCAVCHGVDGLSKVPDAPNLAGNNSKYLSTQLNAFRNGKRQHQQMSIVAKKLSEEDVANLAAWYAAIKIKVEMPKL